MTRTSLMILAAFVAGILAGSAFFISPPEAVAERSSEYEDWVLMYPRGLSITQDKDRVEEIRKAMAAIECPASQGERADAYIRVRYVLPDTDWQKVLGIAKKACESYAVVEDVPSYAEEMAYIAVIMPDYNVTQLSNTAFVFREQSSGHRFLRPEYQFVSSRALLHPEDKPMELAGVLAAIYRIHGNVDAAKGIYDGIKSKR